MSGRYVRVGLGLSSKQQQELVHHGHTRLRHADLAAGGPHAVHLTMKDIRRMSNSHRRGHGLQIKMSPANHTYNLRHGSGFWGDLWSGVKKGASWLFDTGKQKAKQAWEDNKEQLIQRAKQEAQQRIKEQLNRGADYLKSKTLHSGIQGAIDSANQALSREADKLVIPQAPPVEGGRVGGRRRRGMGFGPLGYGLGPGGGSGSGIHRHKRVRMGGSGLQTYTPLYVPKWVG